MKAGALDRKIVIERLAAGVADETGEPAREFAPLATLYAEVLPERGTERLGLADERSAALSFLRFRVRSLPGGVRPSAADRISYAGRLFNVRDVREMGRGRGWELVAEGRNE